MTKLALNFILFINTAYVKTFYTVKISNEICIIFFFLFFITLGLNKLQYYFQA